MRNKKSYSKRLHEDLRMCEEIGGMDDVKSIIADKIESLKEYQRKYQKEWYARNKNVAK